LGYLSTTSGDISCIGIIRLNETITATPFTQRGKENKELAMQKNTDRSPYKNIIAISKSCLCALALFPLLGGRMGLCVGSPLFWRGAGG